MSHALVQHVVVSRTQNYEYTARFDTASGPVRVTLDEAPPLGAGAGPNPAALLSAAVGHCLAASLQFCLEKSHARVDRLEARVTTHVARNEAGRFRIVRIDVELVPGVADADAHRLIRCEDLFEDFCIVTESVRHGIPVNVRVADAQPAITE
jgi:uncharacterized OsmC-like protein